jgi:hypothetical protein
MALEFEWATNQAHFERYLGAILFAFWPVVSIRDHLHSVEPTWNCLFCECVIEIMRLRDIPTTTAWRFPFCVIRHQLTSGLPLHLGHGGGGAGETPLLWMFRQKTAWKTRFLAASSNDKIFIVNLFIIWWILKIFLSECQPPPITDLCNDSRHMDVAMTVHYIRTSVRPSVRLCPLNRHIS